MSKPALTHDDLIKRIKSKGWTFVTSDNGQTVKDNTLEDLAKLSHKNHTTGQQPVLIKDIENTIELDMIQLEKLWQYLGLPN